MKSSALTRSVFRSLLANRPWVPRDCPRRTVLACAGGTASPSRRPGPSHPVQTARRSLFGLSLGNQPKTLQGAKSTPANVELALGKLVDVVRARRTRSRFPPDDQTADAFRFLFASRLQAPRRLTRNEVYLATEAFKHLQERGRVLPAATDADPDGQANAALTEDDLVTVLVALAASTGRDRYRTDARTLASLVFDAWRARADPLADRDVDVPLEHGLPQVPGSLLGVYAAVLAQTGSANEALDLLRTSAHASHRDSLPLWVAALKGLANEGRLSEFWQILEQVCTTVGPLDAISQESLVAFFADHNNMAALKRLVDLPLDAGQVPTTAALVKAVDCAIRHQEGPWATDLVALLRTRTDSADVAGTVLVWSTHADSSVATVRQALEDMDGAGVPNAVTMRTVNRLVADAYAQKQPAYAQQLVDLAADLGLTRDATSWSLQLDDELQRGDRAAARRTFELLCREDIPLDRADVPVLNRYVAGLSFGPAADLEHTHLMQVVDHVLESGGDLTAEAVAGLCHVFLQRDELDEATSLLRYRVDQYPADDRARIAAVFRQFIVDPAVKDQRAYNAYELFRHAFPETGVDERLPLMQSFFDRARPDLACLVFGHMRQREDREARPTADAYARCFAGIARCRDVDGLQMVYNMLKLDLEVEPTTRIHNGLMAAYTACQQPFVAIIDHFWKIMASRQGPTLSSFVLALRACEKWVPQGAHEARHVMALMQRLNLVITKDVYDAYVGALAGQSEFENVVELIEEMDRDVGEPPDAVTLGTFYNAIPWQFRKDEVEKWARDAYPALWADLVTYGDEIDEEWEVRYFQIDRSVDMDDELLFGTGTYHPVLAQARPASLETPSVWDG